MSEQKTHAEIIAEMRFHGQQNIDAEKDKPEYGILTMEGRITQNYAAELDAAHKREIEDAERRGHHAATKAICETIEKVGPLYDAESVGNAAKLREALVKAEAVLDGIRMMVLQGQEYDIHLLDIEGALKECRAALAAPPRNCDRYTGEDINRDVADACTRADNDSMFDYDCEELPIRWLLSTTAQVDEYLKHKNEEDKKMWEAIFDRRQQKTDA